MTPQLRPNERRDVQPHETIMRQERQTIPASLTGLFSAGMTFTRFKIAVIYQDRAPGAGQPVPIYRGRNYTVRVNDSDAFTPSPGQWVSLRAGMVGNKLTITNGLATAFTFVVQFANGEIVSDQDFHHSELATPAGNLLFDMDNFSTRIHPFSPPWTQVFDGSASTAVGGAVTLIRAIPAGLRLMVNSLSIANRGAALASVDVGFSVNAAGPITSRFFNGEVGNQTCKHVTYPIPVPPAIGETNLIIVCTGVAAANNVIYGIVGQEET